MLIIAYWAPKMACACFDLETVRFNFLRLFGLTLALYRIPYAALFHLSVCALSWLILVCQGTLLYCAAAFPSCISQASKLSFSVQRNFHDNMDITNTTNKLTLVLYYKH